MPTREAPAKAGGLSAITAPAVRFDQVVKRIGATELLAGVSFSMPPGERLAIIGPSGAGKTTILRLLMTLEAPTSGTIEVNGQLLAGSPVGERLARDVGANTKRLRRKIGMVFQQFNLFPHMTVIENITEAPVQVLRMSGRDADSLAMRLLESVGLPHKAKSYPRQLSGGEQQRVAIARALALQPEIMLFDEITSALDPEVVGEVLNVVRRLAADTGMTMLVVTHEMRFAREIADRVVFMAQGQIIEVGSAEEIFTAPQNERTRQFLRAVLDY